MQTNFIFLLKNTKKLTFKDESKCESIKNNNNLIN